MSKPKVDPFVTTNRQTAAILKARGETLAEVIPVGDQVAFRFEPGRAMLDAQGADNLAGVAPIQPQEQQAFQDAAQSVHALANQATYTVNRVKLDNALQEAQQYTQKAADSGNQQLHGKLIDAYHSGDPEAIQRVKEEAASYLHTRYILKNDLA